MSVELIMVDGGTIAHGSGSQVSGGAFIILPGQASLKDKSGGKGAFGGPLQYTFSGGDFPGMVSASVATLVPQVIAATAQKGKIEGKFVIRLGDSGVMTAVGTLTAGGTGPAVGPVEVDDAGQDKVKSA